jgi:hypothetical protein
MRNTWLSFFSAHERYLGNWVRGRASETDEGVLLLTDISSESVLLLVLPLLSLLAFPPLGWEWSLHQMLCLDWSLDCTVVVLSRLLCNRINSPGKEDTFVYFYSFPFLRKHKLMTWDWWLLSPPSHSGLEHCRGSSEMPLPRSSLPGSWKGLSPKGLLGSTCSTCIPKDSRSFDDWGKISSPQGPCQNANCYPVRERGYPRAATNPKMAPTMPLSLELSVFRHCKSILLLCLLS